MKLYIYTPDDMLHVATITGSSNASCEATASSAYDDTDTYLWTYTPAFGFAGGLVQNDDADEIEA